MGKEQSIDKNLCWTFTDECIYSRRCFMTGEYCSKQNSIQRERKSSYEKEKPINPLKDAPNKMNIKEITAFVIMNFSDMSDVMYKWRLKTFIESLAKYFYVNEEEKKIYCKSSLQESPPSGCKGVNRIKVVRSDSDPASNYVICSRICQQMQIADLIVVDVSSQNTNVFYEFGMAVALGKMILPICYSESFYKKEKLSQAIQGEEERKKYEHHIGCYPWRKALFEYYGILYKNKSSDDRVDSYRKLIDQHEDEDSKRDWGTDKDNRRSSKEEVRNDHNDEEDDCLGSDTRYLPFYKIKNEGIGFDDDAKYNCFPYDEYLNEDVRIGERTYNLLRNTYNCAKNENNTLVVYTMDGFLNDDQAGQCIVNYHNYIVSRMKEERCFRGDRVGVLVQGSDILEEDKDSRKPQNLFYKVGEIIHIGVNQATYLALGEKIKTDEFLNVPECMTEESPYVNTSDYSIDEEDNNVVGVQPDSEQTKLILPKQKKDIIISVKSHIRNRAMLMYPNYPIYVNRMKKGIQKDLLDTYPCGKTDFNFFCLYYIMLRNLRYTNEIVVDISGTDTQALFWLGAAHGMDVYAITVRHEKSLEEKELRKKEIQQTEKEIMLAGRKSVPEELTYQERKERNIFDVSGLWSAILHSYDTEGFYHQLYLAQSGIERHSRLMLRNMNFYEKRMQEIFSETDEQVSRDEMDKLRKKKESETLHVLESYYRSKFWNRMLKYNRLNLYLPQIDVTDENDNQKRIHAVKWDVSSIAALSHYLSKRTVIGEYRVQTLKKGEPHTDCKNVNFICIGGGQKPLGESLAEHVYEQMSKGSLGASGRGYNIIHMSDQILFNCPEYDSGKKEDLRCYKGFKSLGDKNQTLYSQHPSGYCAECKRRMGDGEDKADGIGETGKVSNFCTSLHQDEKNICRLGKGDTHIQLAQVILWRDISTERHEKTFYRVEINGSSGPATVGLSTLFVDDEQKQENFTENKHWEEHDLLCELQKEIRKKLMEAFIEELNLEFDSCNIKFASEDDNKRFEDADKNQNEGKKKSKQENQKERYFSLVRHSITLYLSTVLYRYFLPFLSEEDVDRICNSTSSYIASLKAEDISPFAFKYPCNGDPDFQTFIAPESVEMVIGKVEKTLKDVLNRFKGVEAFYEVLVKVDTTQNPTEQDTRNLVDIKRLNVEKPDMNELQDGICWLNCLFEMTDEEKEEKKKREAEKKQKEQCCDGNLGGQ